MGSTRLPGKILKKIGDLSLLEIHIKRLLKSTRINNFILATTTSTDDDPIVDFASAHNVNFFRGSVQDVLDRFYQASKESRPDWVIRFTSDCPLVDPALADDIVDFCLDNGLDYCTNGSSTFPDGTDVEVIRFSALEEAWNKADLLSEREHVTPYIIKRSSIEGKDQFKAAKFTCGKDWSDVRITIDNEEDFLVMQKLVTDYGINEGWEFYAQKYYDDKLNLINGFISRNEGYFKSVENDKKL